MVIYIFLLAIGIFFHLYMHMEESIATLMLTCHLLHQLPLTLRKKKKNQSSFLVQRALNEIFSGFYLKFIFCHSPPFTHLRRPDPSNHTPALGPFHLLFTAPILPFSLDHRHAFTFLFHLYFPSFPPRIPKDQMIIIFYYKREFIDFGLLFFLSI